MDASIIEEAEAPHVEPQDRRPFGEDSTCCPEERTIAPETDDEVHIQRTEVRRDVAGDLGMKTEVLGERLSEGPVTPEADIRAIQEGEKLGEVLGVSG